MSFEKAQYIIIGMEDGWLMGTQEDYDEAKRYVIAHIGELHTEKIASLSKKKTFL